MRLLITRPTEDAESLSRELKGRGHETLIEPLLAIQLKQADKPETQQWQAILATSANGIRALAAQSWFEEFKALPLLAVGSATASLARTSGFVHVEQAGGDVTSLADLAKTTLTTTGGTLLHVAGSSIAGDLKDALEAEGFIIVRATLYEARAAHSLSDTAKTAFNDKTLDGVLFYSPRTARTFVELISAAQLTETLRSVSAYCLSAAVAEKISDFPWLQIHVASTPEQDALLALLDTP